MQINGSNLEEAFPNDFSRENAETSPGVEVMQCSAEALTPYPFLLDRSE